ncbi:YafY family transcriptional regulator [Bradyrhizobium sp. U87765 SZCCT0131]|uniref:helix-turn-helix transcriptional regulator n=1 Tax=unclassified Bradyrhizobium TaxID=2631580 RepID=UPI001BA5EBB4|nr:MULTISPECIES: YafY family protein [unclassified Bradyrhizobium]MBR1219848.1 YafY family transcriptional regulator [Bradyrhizobium sp. U87765 SZCCT0131]MBR1262499.1 YafY family transcriptional regulator [Bradyrhizobium sp. U87765 SZCCT0134]MBR1308318.1 YafY family transcriptional regulator [Bradyrhizobium sp. U87765 SZCCT0110]MBR1318281.1 YafY family transcriptional regulator [Bradyrhizobium sp. U87765 SZCCT0109]MBR1351984.1 YafY family transcriptional regulator [Bradyrhizobium sp. U87765 SZ
MRASRLLTILTTLQARGRVTAKTLADECEVSLRTIYRDVDALSAAGIPVYSERGSEGGYRLLDGYRTRLNGLSAREAEALFMTGLSGPAADLGLGAVMAAAQTKLLAAMPVELRAGAERVRARFHLDAPGWFGEAEQPAHLTAIANAVWEQRALQIRYRSWKAEKHRRIEPLGIVLKGGSWYVAGQVGTSVRIYRIARIRELAMLDERFERPESFDLATFWADSTQRLGEELHSNRATVRLSPMGVKLMEMLLSPLVRNGAVIAAEADADGWRVVTLPVGSERQAAAELMSFGPEAEVLAPQALRLRIAALAAELVRLYGEKAHLEAVST